MREELLGSTQPVLSLSLAPGESVVARPGEFAWLTDAIQITAGPPGLSAYTAKDAPGTVAFAARVPGSILAVELGPERVRLVHRRAFMAGTPAVDLSAGLSYPACGADAVSPADAPADDVMLLRVGGNGRAWVELSGDVVRRDLRAGESLRTHPWHVGMCDASVTVQLAALPGPVRGPIGGTIRHVALLSGPGSVWLQSMPLLAEIRKP